MKTMRIPFIFIPALAVLLSAPLGAYAAPAQWEASSRLPQTVASPLPGDGLQVSVHRLKNGLTVYLSPNHETPRISAWILVTSESRSAWISSAVRSVVVWCRRSCW